MNILQKWYCRAGLSILLGSALIALHSDLWIRYKAVGRVMMPAHEFVMGVLGGDPEKGGQFVQWQWHVAIILTSGFLDAVFVLVAYGIFMGFRRKRILDNETRCRECQYILKGISEPRCSECGECI